MCQSTTCDLCKREGETIGPFICQETQEAFDFHKECLIVNEICGYEDSFDLDKVPAALDYFRFTNPIDCHRC